MFLGDLSCRSILRGHLLLQGICVFPCLQNRFYINIECWGFSTIWTMWISIKHICLAQALIFHQWLFLLYTYLVDLILFYLFGLVMYFSTFFTDRSYNWRLQTLINIVQFGSFGGVCQRFYFLALLGFETHTSSLLHTYLKLIFNILILSACFISSTTSFLLR